jgi:cytochrome c
MKQVFIKPLLVGIISVAVMAPVSAVASDGAALYKSKTCTACHGNDGKTTVMPTYPKIAGQNSAYTLQQMKDIKSGKRNNGMTAAMKGVMHLVNDDEMKALSDYIATMEP